MQEMALYHRIKGDFSSLPDEKQLEELIDEKHILFLPPIKQNSGSEISIPKSKSETSIPGLHGLTDIQTAKVNALRRLTAVNLRSETALKVQLQQQSSRSRRKITPLDLLEENSNVYGTSEESVPCDMYPVMLPEKLPLLPSLLNQMSETNKGDLIEMLANQHSPQVCNSTVLCNQDFWEMPQAYRSSTHTKKTHEIQQSETKIGLMPCYYQSDAKPEQKDNQKLPSLNNCDNPSLLKGTAISENDLPNHAFVRSYDIHRMNNMHVIAKNKKTLSDTISESNEASEGKLKLSAHLVPLSNDANAAYKLDKVNSSNSYTENASVFVTSGVNTESSDKSCKIPETLLCCLSPVPDDYEGKWTENNESKVDFITGSDMAVSKQSHSESSNLIPVVHITFSEQEPLRKPLTSIEAKMKKYDTNDSACNFNHSFNIFAKKRPAENARKARPKSKSAMTQKYHKVSQGDSLSTEISATQNTKPEAVIIKVSSKHPVLPLVASHNAVTKLPKRAPLGETKPSTKNNEKNKKQGLPGVNRGESIHCKLKSPTSAQAIKSNSDFLHLSHGDMFEKITCEEKGPEICEMFATSPYIQTRETAFHEQKSSRSTGSAPPLRGLPIRIQKSSNELVRSKTKRPTSQASAKGKKNPGNLKKVKSAGRKETKHDCLDCENRNNVAIISGPGWYIKTPKTETVFKEIESKKIRSLEGLDKCQSVRLHMFNNKNWDLSVIKEATIEDISANIRDLKETQKTTENSYKLIHSLSYSQHLNHSSEDHMRSIAVDHDLPKVSLFNLSRDEITQKSTANLMDCVPCQDSGESPQVSKSKKDLKMPFSFDKKCQEDNTTANHSRKLKLNIWISENDDSVSQNSETVSQCINQSEVTDKLLKCLADELNLLDEKDSCVTLSNFIEEHQNSSFKENTFGTQHACAVDEQCKCEEKEHDAPQTFKSAVRRAVSVTDVENRNGTEDYVSWIKGNSILGRGAYGIVYCGLTSHGELIAVKQVPLDMSDHATAEKEYKKMQEEVDLLKTLKHENIVAFLGTSLENNTVSIFMEYIPGGSIANLIIRFGPLREKVFCEYTKQILKGVKYLHDNNVVHRDIKGNNIMVMPPGIIKLIDFGCAKQLLYTSKTETETSILKSMRGTPYWMAPEVINGTGHGRKSDIWSIGCTVFEMATGKPPLAEMNRIAAMFYIGSHKGLMPSLPGHCSEHARNFVQLCLTSDKHERPSAKQLLQDPFIMQQRTA